MLQCCEIAYQQSKETFEKLKKLCDKSGFNCEKQYTLFFTHKQFPV